VSLPNSEQPNNTSQARGALGRGSALPCPAGRSGPWPRRTGAPQASATRQDRNPDAHEIAQGTRHDTPGCAGTGWNDASASAQLEGLAEVRRASASTPRGQLGPGVRLPRALRTLAHEAVDHRGRPRPRVERGAVAARWEPRRSRRPSSDHSSWRSPYLKSSSPMKVEISELGTHGAASRRARSSSDHSRTWGGS
jgi:hypothetical protein